MVSIRYIALAAALIITSAIAESEVPMRLDATTAASAEASWNRMLEESDKETQNKLRGSLLQLIAASGLHGLALHAALEDPSVVRVKDTIADLTAKQVIELANQTSAGK
jgi:pyruvate/2-oxoglutarate dehydrogenase complex dihydrolipoamide dehydrogenase (E3) component